MSIEQEMRIKELEKQIEQLSFVRGINDKFGSYKSLKKNAEIVMFFLASSENKRRYVEVIDNFKGMWGKSTIEKHLSDLTKKGILSRTHLPGEYEVAYDMSRDMDMLVQYLIGSSLYNLAKKSWEKKDYRY